MVPLTDNTLRLAERLAPRWEFGIEMALVGSRGEVTDVKAGVARNDA